MAVSNPYIIPLSWRNMTLVISSGLALWLLPWMAWPIWRPVSVSTPQRKLPIFRYIKGVQGLNRSTWSPVLIPLPTPDGFSKKATVEAMPNKNMVSVLKPRISEPLYLALVPPVRPQGGTQGMSPLERPSFDPERVTTPVFGDASGPAGNGIQIEIPEALQARMYDAPSLKTVPLAGVEVPSVFVSAYVELDRKGRVQHVLLEQPSGLSTVDAAIVRSLQAGMGQPGDDSVAGTVKIYYWKRH